MASRAFRQTRTTHPHARSCRRIALGCFATSAVLFTLSPLGALWHLADAVRHGNVDALRQGMDWRALRVALKGDLSDLIHPAPAPAPGSIAAATPVNATVTATVKLASAQVAVSAAPALASDDELPEFGSSFVSNVVSNAVDDEVTPEHLLTLIHPDAADPAAAAAPNSLRAVLHRLAGLAFTAPDRFEAAFLLSDHADAPVRLTLRIEHWHWKVVAIRLPDPPPAAPPVTTADARRT